ncbi:MAG TPA: serine hydrolase, partial [Thermomicrobiaceae bacterium]|nr:serine hydrolase [Thermomicrobiaceae bacterium]
MRRLILAITLALLLAPVLDARAAVSNSPASAHLEAAATWSGLQSELQALVAGWSGENAVSVTDLQTGQTISVNGARPQIAACTIKIGIIMAVAQDIEAGRYTADDVDSLVRSMMGPSNTWPARELLGYVGGGDIGAGIRRVNDLMHGLGATGSLLAHPPGYPEEDYGYGDASNVLTTDDLNLMLGKLYRGQALSPWATGYVLWSLTIAPDWMDQSLGAPLPDGVRLYHKIGQLYEPENTWNDAGLVVFSRNGHDEAYAISYLGSYGPSWQDAYAHAQSVSATAWHYFDAAYSNAAPPAPLPTSRFFPQTGFTILGGFLRYWEQFGGLPVFGYP